MGWPEDDAGRRKQPLACGGCWEFARSCCGGRAGYVRLRRASSGPTTQEEFTRRIEFLATVPLFARMPRAEYPMIATVLKIRRWREGEVILDFGESRAQFFLVADGCAFVKPDVRDRSSLKLQRGDYFGDTLLTQRLPGKVTAGADLVTLSMSAAEFQHFGVARYLRCNRRRAVGRPGFSPAGGLVQHVRSGESELQQGSGQSREKTAAQRDFVAEAVRRNALLRSLVGLREEVVQQMCDVAEREEVAAGTEVYRRGDYGGRFYMVESGSFLLRTDGEDGLRGGKLGRSETMQRLMRKEHFLQQLIAHEDAAEDEGAAKHRRATSGGADLYRTHSDDALAEKLPRQCSAGSNSDEGGLNLVRMNSDPCEASPPAHRSAAAGAAGDASFGDVHVLPQASMVLKEQSGRARDGDFAKGIRRAGDSFGEMALLYHAPRPFTAVAREDSVVWFVDQDAFRGIMANKAQSRSEKVARELDKVDLFQGLLSHEKLELAESFSTLTFKEGDWIVRQGEFQNVWYVLASGECSMSRTLDSEEKELTTLRPVHHFGERALLRGTPSEFSVRVLSQDGARCLVLDGPTFKDLGGLLKEDISFRRAVEDDLESFAQFKGSCNPKLTGLLGRLKETRERGPLSVPTLDPSLSARALDRVGLLGVGAFGTVTLEKDPASGKLFALKTLSKGLVQSQQLQESVRNERAIMTMVDSPFLLRLHGTYKDDNYLYFLLEPMLGGDLHFLIRSPETSVLVRRPAVHKFLVACVVCGLEHLHERNVVFRDLKSENVLLASNGYAKLCDFGFAKFVLGRTMTLCGTPEYVAPEVIMSVGYDRMVDWWALGVLTFEAICGDTPFSDPDDDPSPVVVFQRVMAGVDHLTFFPFDDSESLSFIKSLLQSVPTKRLGIGGVLQVKRHAFFAGVDFEAMERQEVEAPYVPPLKSEEDLSMFDTEDQDMPRFVDYVPDGSDWDADF